MHVDRRFVDIMAGASDEDPQQFLRSLAWANIPILSEWRRFYPDRDPLDVHENARATARASGRDVPVERAVADD